MKGPPASHAGRQCHRHPGSTGAARRCGASPGSSGGSALTLPPQGRERARRPEQRHARKRHSPVPQVDRVEVREHGPHVREPGHVRQPGPGRQLQESGPGRATRRALYRACARNELTGAAVERPWFPPYRACRKTARTQPQPQLCRSTINFLAALRGRPRGVARQVTGQVRTWGTVTRAGSDDQRPYQFTGPPYCLGPGGEDHGRSDEARASRGKGDG
jgi:hypothetical protein